MPTLERLIQRLSPGVVSPGSEADVLRSLFRPPREVQESVSLSRTGESPLFLRVVLSGFACRYRILEDGRRQIIAFILPGDFCNLTAASFGTATCSVTTLSGCVVAEARWSDVEDAAGRCPGIARALSWSTLVENDILREWLVNLGQRLTEVRMAHLFCELACRLTAVGHLGRHGFPVPLTQKDLGDALGVSTVHVNRVLQALRNAGLVKLTSGRLWIPDFAALADYAHFTADYLHLPDKALAAMPLHRKAV